MVATQRIENDTFMQLELGGSVAVVTGGASGIGWACAQTLAREGCRVCLWDISEITGKMAATLSRESSSPSQAVVVNISDTAAVDAALRETEAALGPVSHLVHAAAIGSGKFGFPFTNVKPSDWLKVLDVNVMGMVHVAHAIAPGMVSRRDGTMVFVASVAGQIGSQTDPPYSASKAANINFAQCLAKDMAPHNVRVNIVNPGMVRTPLNRQVWQAWYDQQTPDKRRTYEDWADEKVRTVVPLGRWQETQDVADMVVFLSSARTAQVTGQTINVDGGQVMHW
jgi:2-hydroxycyclohexanecarboxyl-CoA dehydrogenase